MFSVSAESDNGVEALSFGAGAGGVVPEIIAHVLISVLRAFRYSQRGL